jgi:small-conductance mechanosensitive channel
MLFIVVIGNVVLTDFRFLLSVEMFNKFRHVLHIALIISIGYMIIKAIALIKDMLLAYYERKAFKDYTFRSIRTKFQLIQRILNVIIIFALVTVVLMTFRQVRQIGGTLLASAGIAGIVIGLAAQRSLGSILTGIQIAISQPVKIEDTVVVEGTFGTVGEITLTYVVINTWDEKRLIVPINYFLEKPIQNWSRVSPEVIGKVKVYADYTLPVDELRNKFNGWINDSKLWDKRKAALLVTDANDKTIELRATMSAKNSEDAFDLECFIREKIVTWINQQYPNSLPSSRIFFHSTTA